MEKKKQQVVKENDFQEKATSELKSIQELKSFDLGDTDVFVCDMETGMCGPANQEEEKNE